MDKYKSVFIIEDDPSTARLMRQLIEAEGFLVFIAVNGLEAFEKLDVLDETHKPCLILCDLQMPIMTGWQFVEEAQRRHKVVTVPLVIHSSEPVTPPGYRALCKPVDRVSLLAIVREHCGDALKKERA